MFGAISSNASQINLPAVFVANGLGVCLLLAILYGNHKKLRDSSYDGIVFRWMCRICLALCALETMGFVLEGRLFPGARQAAVVCSSVILAMAGLLGYLWVCYVNYKLALNRNQTRISRVFAAIPAGAVGLMAAVNLRCTVFFWISESNIYHRTPLLLFPWIVVYGYMAWGAIQSYRYQRRVDRRLFIPVLMFLAPIYLGSLIQLFCYGISLIWVSVAVGLTFLYINLQSEQAYLDPLTRLYNRGYLLHYMDHLTEQSWSSCQIAGIMLDINDFKKINDTLGHSEGDAVLRAVGKLLLHAAGNNTVVRYGGDEFVILLETARPERIQTVLDNIQRGLREYNASRGTLPQISFSMGTAKFDQTDIFRFFQEMDKRMYEDKRAFYLRRETMEQSTEKV